MKFPQPWEVQEGYVTKKKIYRAFCTVSLVHRNILCVSTTLFFNVDNQTSPAGRGIAWKAVHEEAVEQQGFVNRTSASYGPTKASSGLKASYDTQKQLVNCMGAFFGKGISSFYQIHAMNILENMWNFSEQRLHVPTGQRSEAPCG